MVRAGQPQGWSQRHQGGLGITLPEGAKFYVTPSHGYLRVDTRLHAAKVTDYDYQDGPNHVLLEEDYSMTLWLDAKGLIPDEAFCVWMKA
jgi:hypothetical protein